jgi:hypothetical protein
MIKKDIDDLKFMLVNGYKKVSSEVVKNLLEDLDYKEQVIKDLEWSGKDGNCPICNCSPFNGHDIGCRLNFSLNK